MNNNSDTLISYPSRFSFNKEKIRHRISVCLSLPLRILKYSFLWCAAMWKRLTAKGPCFILANTPVHGNLGDHALVSAARTLISDAVPGSTCIELPGYMLRRCSRRLCSPIIRSSPIIIPGGGFMGTLWPVEERTLIGMAQCYPGNQIIVLPQTMHYADTPSGHVTLRQAQQTYSAHKNILINTRETASYEFCKEHFPSSHPALYPDLVLYLNSTEFTTNTPRRGALLCLRSDIEKITPDGFAADMKQWLTDRLGEPVALTDTVVNDQIFTLAKRERLLRAKLTEFAGARFVLTDRLHGMLFALLAGTPCVALDNSSGKVSGVYEWIRHCTYIRFCSEPSKILEDVEDMLNIESSHYDNALAQKQFAPLCELLRDSIK